MSVDDVALLLFKAGYSSERVMVWSITVLYGTRIKRSLANEYNKSKTLVKHSDSDINVFMIISINLAFIVHLNS